MSERGPRIVGIVNVTPDSFSDGGRYRDLYDIVGAAERMGAEGADIIEVGGESTRPGAAAVPVEAECARVIPVLRALAARVRVPLCVDTSKAEVARQGLAEGAVMVNDVTALRGDAAMAEVLARAQCRVVLMHMQGTPRDMQNSPHYDDVLGEITAFLADRIRAAEARGIARARVIVDPGIGFGKRVSDNLRILRDGAALRALGCPVMIGASRKSFLGKITGRGVSEREVATSVANVFALLAGADYLRVHDVGAARDTVRLAEAVRASTTVWDGMTEPCARS